MSITRTTHRIVTFFYPFRLTGHARLFPAGEYQVDTVEQLDISAAIRTYRKIKCQLHLWSDDGSAHEDRILHLDPAELERALALDSDPLRDKEREQMIAQSGEMPGQSALRELDAGDPR